MPEKVDDAVHRQARQRRRRARQVPRRSSASDAIREKLEEKVVADATKPGPQREVSQIYLSTETAALPEDAVKVRHILYSPKDDPAGAQAGTIPPDGPLLGQGQGRRRRRVRQAPGGPHAVRRDRPGRERRGERPGPDRIGRRARRVRQRGQQLRPDVLGADPRGQADRRPDPRPDQDRVRVPHRPGPQPRAGPRQAQDAGRRWRRLREARPRLLGRPGGEPRRRPRLGRPGPAREGARRRPSSRPRSARPRDVVTVPDDGELPVQGREGGRADARRSPARGDPRPRVRRLVPAQEGRGRGRAGPEHPERRGRLGTAPCSTRS